MLFLQYPRKFHVLTTLPPCFDFFWNSPSAFVVIHKRYAYLSKEKTRKDYKECLPKVFSATVFFGNTPSNKLKYLNVNCTKLRNMYYDLLKQVNQIFTHQTNGQLNLINYYHKTRICTHQYKWQKSFQRKWEDMRSFRVQGFRETTHKG